MSSDRIDVRMLVSFIFLTFLAYNLIQDRRATSTSEAIARAPEAMRISIHPPDEGVSERNSATDKIIQPEDVSPNAFTMPYISYEITQDLHGFAYGHMALDLSAGKGVIILSPINGVVIGDYVDELGNTTLVIENERYRVMLLHGKFKVSVGEQVRIGQPVGKESNQGNTVDALGRSCRGRDCGYHTHLNVFDKWLQSNVNPLNLINNQ